MPPDQGIKLSQYQLSEVKKSYQMPSLIIPNMQNKRILIDYGPL
jgi:hypothetical protein